MARTGRQRATVIAVVAAIVLSTGDLWAHQESADSSRAATAHSLRTQGLWLGYNLDHADALAVFKAAGIADPGDPTAPRLAAATAWINLLFEQGAITVDDYLGEARAHRPRTTPAGGLDTTFHQALTQALSLSEERLRHHPSDADAHYQLGAAYGCLASYTATIDGHVLGSLGPARRAYHEHERALELDPRRKDAGLVVGTYRYAVASLPAPLRVLAHLAGLGGDRARALRMVEEAAQYPSDAQPNALFTLVLLYNREHRYDDALRVIGELQRRFPRNRLLWLEAGNTSLRAGRPADAKAALDEGLTRLSHDSRPRAVGEDARWAYAYGAALVASKSRGAADAQLRTALAGATRDWLRGRVHKELGKLADLDGDRPRALDEYRFADRLCRRDHDGDCSGELQTLIRAGYQ